MAGTTDRKQGRLDGEVVLVTGGGSGIGLAVARKVVEEGGKVAIADIDPAAAQAALETLPGGHQTAWAGQVDISDETSVRDFTADMVENFGRPTVLINNAGIRVDETSVLECSQAAWDRTFAVNARGTFLVSRSVLPHMIDAGGGAIVNVSSAAGLVARQNLAAYSATKGAIIALTRSMAADFGSYGIRVNVVCPGSTVTPAFERVIENAPDPEAMLQARKSRHLLGRLGQPEDVANAIVFLASKDADWITGGVFPVDGGNTA